MAINLTDRPTIRLSLNRRSSSRRKGSSSFAYKVNSARINGKDVLADLLENVSDIGNFQVVEDSEGKKTLLLWSRVEKGSAPTITNEGLNLDGKEFDDFITLLPSNPSTSSVTLKPFSAVMRDPQLASRRNAVYTANVQSSAMQEINNPLVQEKIASQIAERFMQTFEPTAKPVASSASATPTVVESAKQKEDTAEQKQWDEMVAVIKAELEVDGITEEKRAELQAELESFGERPA